MPTAIPYDPSLSLGSIIDQNLLKTLLDISAAQAPIDAAQDNMNSLISMKRSLDMTTQELIDMGINPTDLMSKSQEIRNKVSKAAGDYATIRMSQEDVIRNLKLNLQGLHANIESPIDYNRTKFTSFPLAADSLKMDCQYFSYDENKQSIENTVSSIQSYIGSSASYLGYKAASEASTSAASQINRQHQNHEIDGTLIISVTCTHKNALVLAPFILDVDKAIRVWNSLYTADQDKIKVNDVASMIKIAQEEGTDKEKFLSMISGATFGSCFIGMVHVLRQESTSTSQYMMSTASHLQSQAEAGGWFAHVSGGFGVDSSFAQDIKNMLSSQKITSHVNLISMGVIPTIKASSVKLAVKEINADPGEMMGKLATLANANSDDAKSVASAATGARTGAQMGSFEKSKIESVLSSLSTIDDGENSILDINTMMTALDDYVTKVSEKDAQVGVPVNYHVKNISRTQLAQMWTSKYFPSQYLTVSGDDSNTKAEE